MASAPLELIISPLQNNHDRAAFDCGVPSLNRYLKTQAGQDSRRDVARVFIAAQPDAPEAIAGYYTLSTFYIELKELPAELRKKLPRYPVVPAAFIGWLAVSRSIQGRKTGQRLLMDACARTLVVGKQMGIYALVAEALDEGAGNFYQQYGFVSLEGTGRRLFLPLRHLGDRS